MVSIGEYTYCPTQLTVHYENQAELSIGKFCSIGDNVQIFLGGNHRSDWLSQHPLHMIFKEENNGHPATRGNVVIGHDVWIGKDAIIMSGVTIGNGAVIGAGSVVRRDVPAYTIVIGNPAQFLRMRFDWQVINTLQAIQWWDWPLLWIEDARWMLQSDKVDDLYHYWVRMRTREYAKEGWKEVCIGIQEEPPKGIAVVRKEQTSEGIYKGGREEGAIFQEPRTI
jgi:virginiamycin A acetyltransferase